MMLKKTSAFIVILLFAIAIIAISLPAVGCNDYTVPTVINGSFELLEATGAPAGWYSKIYRGEVGKVEIASDPQRNNVLHIVNLGANDSRLCQELKVSPNTPYRLTCYVRTENVVGGAGANIGIYGVAATSTPVLGTNDWMQIELVGRTTSEQNKLIVSLCVGGHGAESVGEAWFDDFEIELADNPGSATIYLGNEGTSDSKSAITVFPTSRILTAAFIGTIVTIALYLLYLPARKAVLSVESKNRKWLYVVALLIVAFILRIVLAALITGHETDINCFTVWGNRIVDSGTADFYDMWCDYPPGYMLVLGLMSSIARLFGIPLYTASGAYNTLFVTLIKLPCIIIDIASAYIVYAIAKKRMSYAASLMLMCLVAFSPIMAYVSSAWGQIDQALTFLLIVPILLLYSRMPILAGLVYGVAIIVKPQALMAGPIFAAAYLVYIFNGSQYRAFDGKRGLARLLKKKQDGAGLRVLETALAVVSAIAVIILVTIPFTNDRPWYWLLEKYYDTATSYEYATVNAYNYWALIGANWAKTSEPYLGLNYGSWGTIFMIIAVTLGIGLYVFDAVKHRGSKGAFPLSMAYMFAGMFTFGHYMHERYLFPVLMLLMLAFIMYNDRRLIWTYLAYSCTMLVNCIAAYYYSELFDLGLYWDERIIFWCSLANVILFAWFSYVAFDLIIRKKPWKSIQLLNTAQ